MFRRGFTLAAHPCGPHILLHVAAAAADAAAGRDSEEEEEESEEEAAEAGGKRVVRHVFTDARLGRGAHAAAAAAAAAASSSSSSSSAAASAPTSPVDGAALLVGAGASLDAALGRLDALFAGTPAASSSSAALEEAAPACADLPASPALTIRYLTTRATPPADANCMRHADGVTPLHVACEFGLPDVVAALLLAGADVNAVAVDGATPLAAARAGRREEAGAAPAAEVGAR